MMFNNSILVKTNEFKNKLEVLKYISECIEEKSSMDKNLALAQLKQREELGYTTFNQIAIPHILDPVDSDSFSVIIILDKHIKWNSQNVRLIYSLVVGKEHADMSLYYEKLGNFLSSPSAVKDVLDVENPMEFMKVFLNA